MVCFEGHYKLIKTIIIPAMGWLLRKISIPPSFLAVILRNNEDVFGEMPPERESS